MTESQQIKWLSECLLSISRLLDLEHSPVIAAQMAVEISIHALQEGGYYEADRSVRPEVLREDDDIQLSP